MPLDYQVSYSAVNHYDSIVNNAVWQFLIIPENNDSQEVIWDVFTNSLNVPSQYSINGFGFRTFVVRPKVPFTDVRFSATFRLVKQEVNPFDFIGDADPLASYHKIEGLEFRATFEPFLKSTPLTSLPEGSEPLFNFDKALPIFKNLLALNHWVYKHLYFRPGVTHVHSTLKDILGSRKGVCQDFTHLFCALTRQNQVPARYVSGYLHQGNGYFGDSQMHAWAEVYVPGVGWTGFDPTNDLLAGTNHIKVAHGRDYKDCAPLKGVIFAPGNNRTEHTVEVVARQSQQ